MRGIKLLFSLYILALSIFSYTLAYTGEKDNAPWSFFETGPQGIQYYINPNSIQVRSDDEIWVDVKAVKPNTDYYAVFSSAFYSSGWSQIRGMKLYHIGTLKEVSNDTSQSEPTKVEPDSLQGRISKDLFDQLKAKRQKEYEEYQAFLAEQKEREKAQRPLRLSEQIGSIPAYIIQKYSLLAIISILLIIALFLKSTLKKLLKK